jgi:hypothetical protein
MKLPRYLQLALVVTAGAVLWSLFAGEEEPLSNLSVQPVSQPSASQRTKAPPETPVRQTRANLFALPQTATPEQEQEAMQSAVEPPPSAPPLPLNVLGTWWDRHQRIILLTDGVETWPVCDRCHAEGKIWIGSSPINDWVLKGVEKDHLLFEWLPGHIQQPLELGDLQSEPTY